MRLIGITIEDVIKYGILDGQYYKYCLGERLKITSSNRRDSNKLLSTKFCETLYEDVYIKEYSPTNVIYFDVDLILEYRFGKLVENMLSYEYDEELSSIKIGTYRKYSKVSGILATTGLMSANRLVQSERKIFYSSKIKEDMLMKYFSFVAIGLVGDKTYGILEVFRRKGIAVQVDDSDTLGITAYSYEEKDCWEWNFNTSDYLLSSCEISEVED